MYTMTHDFTSEKTSSSTVKASHMLLQPREDTASHKALMFSVAGSSLDTLETTSLSSCVATAAQTSLHGHVSWTFHVEYS